MHQKQTNNLPRFGIFGVGILGKVLRCETIYAHLDALVDSLTDLEHVNTLVRWRARKNILSRMENEATYVGLTISSFELLHEITAISAENLDNVTSHRSWCYKSTVVVHCDRAYLGRVMCKDLQVYALVDH